MKLKIRDIFVILLLLLISLSMAFCVQKSKSGEDGNYLRVKLNGKEYGK